MANMGLPPYTPWGTLNRNPRQQAFRDLSGPRTRKAFCGHATPYQPQKYTPNKPPNQTQWTDKHPQWTDIHPQWAHMHPQQATKPDPKAGYAAPVGGYAPPRGA